MSRGTELDDPEETPNSNVQIGDVTFDPVAVQDFCLSVEGTSGVGKSNSLASIIAEGGPVSYESIADRLGVSRTNKVSSAATTLESYKVVEKENRSDGMHVDLNTDGLQEIREATRRRRETADLMENI